MTTPLLPPNSADLETKLARDWVLRVRAKGGTDVDWKFVRGLSAVSPIFEGAAQDASDIDGEGYGSQIVTGLNWRVEFSGKRKGVTTTDVYADDPGQALLRSLGRKTGTENMADFQVYRRDNATDAYQGSGPVIWTDSAASDPTAMQEFSGQIIGNGKPTEITKPTAP